MAYNFNPDKYKNTFNNMFGSGSYTSQLEKARAAGRRAAQAELAVKMMKERQREEEKRREQSRRERYTKNKEEYYDEQVRRGNLDIDDVPDGKLRSEVARNKMESIERMEGRNADVLTGKKYSGEDDYIGELDGEIDSTGVMRPTQYQDYGEAEKKKEEDSGIFDWLLGKHFKERVSNLGHSLNPFDDVTAKEAAASNRELNKDESAFMQESNRAQRRIMDNASLGLLNNLEKKAGIESDTFKNRKGFAGTADTIYDLSGSFLPGVGAAKALRAAGLGAKSNSIGQLAKEGGLAGLLESSASVGVSEALNPEDQNWKQNLANIGLNTTIGAAADPAIVKGGGKLIEFLKGLNKNNTSSSDQLLLPEGQRSLPEGKTQNVIRETGTPRSDVVNIQGQRTRNPYRTKLENFFAELRQMDLPPGREQEYAEELWSHRAEPTDPDLEGLIELAYPPKPNVSSQSINRARQRSVANADGLNRKVTSPNEPNFSLIDQKPLEYVGKIAPPTRVKVGNPNDLMKTFDSLRNPQRSINVEPNKASAQQHPKEKVETIRPEPEPGLKDTWGIEGVDGSQLKDISGFKGATNDVFRIFRDVFGENFPAAQRQVLDPLEKQKANFVDLQEKYLKELDNEIVKGLGIRKGSKESALVQQYGEKEITLDELKKLAPSKWKDIVKAEQWFRKAYDNILEGVNKARQSIYGGNAEKVVPKREDYFRHFREFTGLSGLKNLFESPAAISPQLAGTSQFTKPNSKWASFMQKRGQGPFKRDAVGGFLEYLPSASYSQTIDKAIPGFRNLKKSLAEQVEEGGSIDDKNLNNFLEFLENYANDLAGKTNPYFDRNIQQLIPGGRKSMAALNMLNSRVKTNVILGNVSSALAQVANMPLGVAFAKQHAPKGAVRAIHSAFDKNAPIHKSNFLKERYSQNLYRKFDDKLLQKPQKMAEWLIETADRFGTSFVWNSAYEKGLKEGVPNPIKYADENTRRLVAGRGVGEVPLLQKSKVTQLLMPFTLEVGNLWRVMGDMAKSKDLTGLGILFVANFVLNKGMEEARGFGVTFDPIQATVEALSAEDVSPLQRAGILGGEVLTNTPGGQFLANLYPEYGEVAGIQGPTRKELFGENNPQRFGTGLVAQEALTDPLFKLLPPFGGNQLSKTLDGIESLQNEGVYKDGDGLLNKLPFLGEAKELKYPVEPDLVNKLKSVLFGPSSFSETDTYYDNKRRPLSESQTADYQQAKSQGRGQEFYNDLMTGRRIKTTERKIKELKKNKELSEQEKRERMEKLLEALQGLRQGG